MDRHRPNEHVVHPKDLIKKKTSGTSRGISSFNNKLAVGITNGVGTMWTAYIFTLLAIVSLPAVLTEAFHLTVFPHWLISVGLIALVAWIAQTFLQLVLLPIIIVGQNVIQSHQEAKAETDHKTLTYLANLQEEQMIELKNQGEILEQLKRHFKD